MCCARLQQSSENIASATVVCGVDIVNLISINLKQDRAADLMAPILFTAQLRLFNHCVRPMLILEVLIE